jgi:hypothetical protein
MIWDRVIVLQVVKKDRDELGNDVVSLKSGKVLKARKNAPLYEPVSLENREVTRNEHLFYLPKNQAIPQSIPFIQYRGQVYKVEAVENLTPRFIQLRTVTYENKYYRR